MSESDLLEEEEPILGEDSVMEEEEDLVVEICTLSACFSSPIGFLGFGIQEDGPTLAQDAGRKLMDTVIGMPDPRVMETHELDEIEDHKLDPGPLHKDFVEFLLMQQDRMGAGAIDDGREVDVGSFMSPDSVLRMCRGLAPKDIFSPLKHGAQEVLPETEVEETKEVAHELVPNHIVSIQAVAA